ncbi:MAG: P-II family nitrogen regulator [Candidatus Adiutrix sp.]|jgi:nitrogen regulatory protein P-II 1|nr:P-II family nitrogen regulator [Candidatus Adiutrix sp.]
MKLIIAYVRPEALQNIKCKLFARDIFSMSITNVLGAGQQKGYTEVYRGIQTEVNLLKKLRIEIGINESRVDEAIEAICEGARSGNAGDGVVFVVDVAKGLRIRTGEAL